LSIQPSASWFCFLIVNFVSFFKKNILSKFVSYALRLILLFIDLPVFFEEMQRIMKALHVFLGFATLMFFMIPNYGS
jgi:hypothetical protein